MCCFLTEKCGDCILYMFTYTEKCRECIWLVLVFVDICLKWNWHVLLSTEKFQNAHSSFEFRFSCVPDIFVKCE